MLFGFLLFLFVSVCVLLVFLILLQKGKSSLGAAYGGGSQMLFGGSGGQDLLQKTTWVLGACFMGGSLLLSIMKRPSTRFMRTLATQPTTANQAAQK